MKKRPEGPRYRHLSRYGRVIYYEREFEPRPDEPSKRPRIRFSLKTDDWEAAAAARDEYEARKGISGGTVPFYTVEPPRCRDFAARYLAEDTAHLAWTTKRDRESQLREDGPLLRYLGERKLDEITPSMLREWWEAEIRPRGLSIKTGRAYLDALAMVLGYAKELGLIEATPVGNFRETLRRWSRTKQGRAGSEPGREVRPIEKPEELTKLVAAAREEGHVAHVTVLLCLDAGLRLGEALGLRWGHVAWGAGEDDPARALLIEESRPRGGSPAPPKSGRRRRVALSRRLKAALAELYRARFAPSPEALILDRLEPNNFRHRDWRRICERAGIGHRRIKDLRDTFASQLLTVGVQLGFVSTQLGHADVAITAHHYARWCGGSEYRSALMLRPGEVPADLLARLGGVGRRSCPATVRSDGRGAQPPRPS